MSIVVAWVRKVNNCEELVFASDSRLCGGQRWDQCPKMIETAGKSAVIAFAGDTGYAYPMMVQMNHALSEYSRVITRAMDISDINGHLINQANNLIRSVYDMADPSNKPDVEFLFGGYSWIEKRFRIWKYIYSDFHNKLTSNPIFKPLFGKKGTNIIRAIGDQAKKYMNKLKAYIKVKYHFENDIERFNNISLDLEPFEVLCEMLKNSSRNDTIGGAPQIIKVHQYMRSSPLGVYWPEKTDDFSNRTLFGREMFDYEDTDFWFLDPATLNINLCRKKQK